MHALTEGIEAVAFDLDGTLIDTAPDLAAAANLMLILLGGVPLPEDGMRAMIGAGLEQFVSRVLARARPGGMPDAPLHASATMLFRSLYRQQLFHRSRVYPGVAESLRRLAASGTRLCCVTNKESSFTFPLLEAAGLHAHFALTLCADRAEDRKPSPNMLLSACAHMDVEPSRMLYVGDSHADVQAAHAAGCRVIAVGYGYWHDPPHGQARPDAMIDSLAEIAAAMGNAATDIRTSRAAG